jgi:hypothetical protein
LQTKIQILQNRFQHLKTLHAFFTWLREIHL